MKREVYSHMEKQELIVYALYNKEEDGYLTDDAYVEKEMCIAGYTDKSNALKWLSTLDEPDEFQIKKVKITYEVID